MSLLIDVLNRFKGSQKRQVVHPALKRKEVKRKDRKVLFLLAGLLVVSSVGAYFLTSLLMESFTTPPRAPEDVTLRRTELETRPPPTPKAQSSQNSFLVKEEKEEIVRPPVRSNSSGPDAVEKVVKDIEKPRKPKPLVRKEPAHDFNTLIYLADVSFRKGDLVESARHYENALKLKRDTDVVNNLLVVYARLGRYEKARELLLKFPEESLVYTYLLEFFNSGKEDIALKESERFLHLDSKGYVHFARGYIYERLGDKDRALEEYRTAYKKNPGNPYFAFNYARLLEQNRKYREAYQIYRHLLELKVDGELKKVAEERIRYLKLMGF